jgi:hypothetical protein
MIRGIVKFILGALILLTSVFVFFSYLTVKQEGDLKNFNVYKEVGDGAGKSVKIIVKAPENISKTQGYQDLKEGFIKAYKDTIK